MQLVPQLLLRFADRSPISFDLNLNWHIKDRFVFGTSLRGLDNGSLGFGESVAILAGIQLSDRWFTGLSYDISLSKLRTYNSGSIEVSLRYCFSDPASNTRFVNPRFF